MKSTQLKLLTWSVAIAFGAGLVLYVARFLSQKAEIQQMVSGAEMEDVLLDVPEIDEEVDQVVSYDAVKAGMFAFDWTGKPPPPPPDPGEIKERQGPEDEGTPIADLVKVLMIKADTGVETESNCVIQYRPAARGVPASPTVWVKYVGDVLEAPFDKIAVKSITGAGVEFQREGDEPETLLPDEFRLDSTVTQVSPGEVPLYDPTNFIPRAENYGQPPARTTAIGRNRFRIGIDDQKEFQQDYTKVLSEVRTRRHRDPRTGKYDGIEIRDVPSGSMASRHGAKNGDVIKSINGKPVTSEHQAISYIKNNADRYDSWEIEVWNKGQTRTVTYVPPQASN